LNREVISQCIGVHIGATNDDPGEMEQAMATRFFKAEIDLQERKNKPIDACQRGAKDWIRSGAKLLERDLNDIHLEQFRVAIVFKMMFVGILEYPTMEAADCVFMHMSSVLKRSQVKTTTRFKERYDAMCRIYTIINAIDTVFNYVGGECCNEDYDFDPIDLIKIEPYLFCTEEIALFAFTAISPEIHNTNEYKILKSIWSLWVKSGGKYAQEINLDNSSKVDDYNYIRFDKVGFKLRSAIINGIPIHDGRPSDFNVKKYLKKLSEMTISTVDYGMEDDVDGFSNFNDRFSQPLADGMESLKDAATTLVPNTHFHICLFDNIRGGTYIDPIVEAIDGCRHQHTSSKKILLGCPKRENSIVKHTSVFQTYELSEKKERILEMYNPLFKTTEDKIIRARNDQDMLYDELSKTYKITEDLDDVACVAHAKRMGVEGTDELSKFVDTYGMGARFEKMAVSTESFNYPTDVIKSIEERHSGENITASRHTEGLTFKRRSRKRKPPRTNPQEERKRTRMLSTMPDIIDCTSGNMSGSDSDIGIGIGSVSEIGSMSEMDM
jgi:hypothetical protein